MQPAKISLPYFDMVLERFDLGDTNIQKAFGRHVHWGYWEHPAQADGSADDFAAAAEHLCQRVYATAQIQEGDRVLDVGCGLGGTIASLNEHFNNLHLTGLNIDPRQLVRARRVVQPLGNNHINFIEGDACQLPFADESFDVVLAVECIYHFPSRADFFREVRRVLRPGGRLALCDFVPIAAFTPLRTIITNMVISLIEEAHGRVDCHFTLPNYQKLATKTGLSLTLKEDITSNTLPTCPFVRRLSTQIGNLEFARVIALVECISRFGLLRYMILSFRLSN